MAGLWSAEVPWREKCLVDHDMETGRCDGIELPVVVPGR